MVWRMRTPHGASLQKARYGVIHGSPLQKARYGVIHGSPAQNPILGYRDGLLPHRLNPFCFFQD